MVQRLGLVNFVKSIDTFSNLTVGDSFGKNFFHLVLLFFLSLFRVSSDLPFVNVNMACRELKSIDFWADVGQLLENWHNDVLDEPSLTSSNVSCGSIAHHRDIKSLSFFHISLIEELVKEKICPLGAQIEGSQRGTDITGMESNT